MADFNKSDESRLRKTLLNNYEIDYKTLKNFLGNKNFPEKPSNNPSNVTSINLTGKSFNNGIEKI